VAKKSAKSAPASDKRPRLSEHPRAQRQIRQAKAWGGLAGFVLVGVLSLQAGALPVDALTRALAGGVAVYLAAWVIAVVVWTQIARGELIVAEQRWMVELEERRAREQVEAEERAAARAAERAKMASI
jgi:hypothetical protein